MDKSGANNEPLGKRGQGRAQFEGEGPPRRGRGGGPRGRGGRGRGGRGGRGGGRPMRRMSPSTTASAVEKRRRTEMLEEIKRELEHLQLEIGEPIMDEKRPPGVAGEKTLVQTNVYGIKMDENKTFYRYDVTISAIPRKKKGPRAPPRIEFTKRTKEDSVVTDRRAFCRIAFDYFVQKYSKLFGEDRELLIYDNQSILQTHEPLDFGSPEKKEDTLELTMEDCEAVDKLREFKLVKMLVRKVDKQVELGDLSLLTNDMSKQNHTLPQFLELATAQHPLHTPEEHVILGGGTSYLLNPGNYDFVPEDGPVLSEHNKYLGIGIHKSVRYVEGPNGRGSKKVGLIVESKKTPFHSTDGNLLQKTASIVGNNIRPDGSVNPNTIPFLNQQLKGLHVNVQYPNGHSRDIRVSGVSRLTAHGHMIDVQGKKGEKPERLSVEQYFKRRYEQNLEFPNAPLATSMEDGKTNFYPMEILWPRDNQRAQISQLSARETAMMIRASAVAPDRLKRQIDASYVALNLKDSPYLAKAGIKMSIFCFFALKIMPNPLTVTEARRLPAPTIVMAEDSQSLVDRETGKWKINNKFRLPATIEKWGIYYLPGGVRDNKYNFEKEQMEGFVKAFVNCCRDHGMAVGNPDDFGKIAATPESVENQMKICMEEGCDFVFFITSDAITNLHDVIKKCEQQFEVVTQDCKLSNAAEIALRGKPETVQNIVCKTNEKMGGINYTLRCRDAKVHELFEETLFIGLGISHPGAMGNYERARGATPSVPSVIGYAANMKKDPFDFVGDFVYDEARRDEKFSTIAHIIETCILRYQEHRDAPPKRLVLFRNGQSEGQFATSLQYEIPLLRHALSRHSSDCKVTVLVSQKTHNIRLFAKPMETQTSGSRGKVNLNIKHGTVVDTQLTHPEHNEFYLNSHTAIQGTTRAPRYTTIYDENKFTADEIQQMVYTLAFGHKIINTPTSLPAPVYIGLMYAKRGRSIFKVKAEDPQVVTRRLDDGKPDYSAISNDLSYINTRIRNQRTNA